MVVLFNAGDQLPLIPLVEMFGNGASMLPEQMAAIAVNVGLINGSTVIVNVAEAAHCPAVGVNV